MHLAAMRRSSGCWASEHRRSLARQQGLTSSVVSCPFARPCEYAHTFPWRPAAGWHNTCKCIDVKNWELNAQFPLTCLPFVTLHRAEFPPARPLVARGLKGFHPLGILERGEFTHTRPGPDGSVLPHETNHRRNRLWTRSLFLFICSVTEVSYARLQRPHCSAGVHADRAAGSHRHHRHPDRPAAARRPEGP